MAGTNAVWRRSNYAAERMAQRYTFSSILFLLSLPLLAQLDDLPARYAALIDQADLRRHLDTLASDRYEGRETGLKGQKMAAQYLRERFMELGIPPVPNAAERGLALNGYEQPFPLEVSTPGGLSLVVGGRPIGFMQEFFYFQERAEQSFTVDSVVLVDESSIVGAQVRDRVVLMLQNERPGGLKGDRPPRDLFQEITRKGKLAENAGARLLLLVSPQAGAMMRQYAHYITTPRMKLVDGKAKEQAGRPLQVIVIDAPTAEHILRRGRMSWKKAARTAEKGAKRFACPVELVHQPMRQELQGENILGYVEGSDRKEELVVVTAHYDHIGKDGEEVYNGADDDGSGTVALLELAEAFARAKADGHGPRRSVLFMPVSGEEKGLLGSEWYSEHPVFPLENTVADLNIDMIGRTDSLHQDAAPYVYIIGSDRLSTELHRINADVNARYTRLQLDLTYNDRNDPNRYYYRSDHYNFARKGVPVIFYFSGVHEDYHQPGDEVQKIRFDLLEQRARLVFHTAWELANRPARILVDGTVE